jgi:hypothetical protein
MVMVILDVLGDLLAEPVSKVILAILEDSFEALAVSLFFWTFVTGRFQLRRPGKYLYDAAATLAPAPDTPDADG